MLIPSPRHTAADLALWAELEAADRAHYAAGRVAEKAERSIAFIREFAAAGPCYSGVSWGKDSAVLFDLVARSGVAVPCVWLTYGRATNPDCPTVRDAALARRPGADYREVDVGESEAMRDDFRPAEAATGATRYLSGVRADESGTRAMSIRHLGMDTGKAGRPLAWWTAADVFAHLAEHSLPVHPVYAMLGGGRWDRRHVRTASIGGERGDNRGRREHEREYYGDVLRRLAAGQ